jgi:hypothetical protein
MGGRTASGESGHRDPLRRTPTPTLPLNGGGGASGALSAQGRGGSGFEIGCHREAVRHGGCSPSPLMGEGRGGGGAAGSAPAIGDHEGAT